MPLEKPKKPIELVPRAFGGIKNNFSDDLQATGFEPNIPQTYNGDNLNYHLDATGKELEYVEKVVDYINQMPVGGSLYVNVNNQLDYLDVGSFADKADKDLVNTGRLTNCWTKIPQRIKYTLADGTLTILAGSVAIFPYGTEDKTAEFPIGSNFLSSTALKVVDTYWDGSKFFVWAELQTGFPRKSTYNTSDFIYLNKNGGNSRTPTNTACSGSTADTTLGTYIFWYDTTNNYVKFSADNGVTWNTNNSLPLVVAQGISTTGYTSIQHTFNGWGYIGKEIWWENLEGLISDGYNNDGTYNNYTLKASKIRFRSATLEATTNYRTLFVNPWNTSIDSITYRCFEQEEQPNITGTNSNNWYNPKTNKSYFFDGTYWDERPNIKILSYSTDGTNIIGVTDTPQTFRPINYKSDHNPQADGQWVAKRITNNTQTAIGEYTYDLSEYLPKDNYDYEVMMGLHLYRTGGTKEAIVFISTDVFTRIHSGSVIANSYHSNNVYPIPVSSGRYIKYSIENAELTSGLLYLFGYRRLGKNN